MRDTQVFDSKHNFHAKYWFVSLARQSDTNMNQDLDTGLSHTKKESVPILRASTTRKNRTIFIPLG
jgi:hypothetical protein